MARGVPQPQFDFRGPQGWQRQLLIGLLVLYVFELIVVQAYSGLRLYDLLGWKAWSGWEPLLAPWQPLTRFLVQGPGVIGVLIELVVLYLVLPTLNDLLGERGMVNAFVAGAVGASLLPFVADVSGLPLADSQLLGWGSLVWVPFVLLGILRPRATVYLIIFPIEARYILWGSLVLSILMIISSHSVGSVEPLGVWLGTFGWYHLVGPGRPRRREPAPEPPSVMKQRRQFQVIDGGRSDDDDMVH